MSESPVGRKVTFEFLSGHRIFGEVKHMPIATGDSWILEDEGGTLFYINTFAYMMMHPLTGDTDGK